MSDQPFEHAVREWLEDGSDRTPRPAIDAVLLAVKTTRQERDLSIPRRFTQMPTHVRLAAAIAIVAVVGFGALTYFGNDPGVGGAAPPATATPTPTASTTLAPSFLPPLDTSDWLPYTSSRYGFTIARPEDWTANPAERDWSFDSDYEAWAHLEATDHFVNPEGSVSVSAWSSTVAPGETVESWSDAYCMASQNAGYCSEIADHAVRVETQDGHPGLGLFPPNSEAMAFFLDGQTIYVVAVWRGESDPSVQPYGGARRLLESFVSTMTMPATSTQESPAT